MSSMAGQSEAAPAPRVRVEAVALLVFVLAIAPFLSGLNNDFVSWDDDRNFLRNWSYRGLGLTQLKWMWTTFHMGHYHPLTWMSHGMDYVLWGMNPRGYHVTNFVLHGTTAVVLFCICRRVLALALGRDRDDDRVTWASAIGALLFAVHPLRVESVAWATERRDVLSMLFYSLTLLAYLRAVEQPVVTTRKYAAVFALYFAALLSKATAMTLPATLLILNVYPLRRFSILDPRSSIRQLGRELAPLAMLSAAAMIVSIRALHPGEQLVLLDKLAVSAYGLGFYMWKTLVPLSLGPIYPMPLMVPAGSAPYLASYVVVGGLALLVAMQWRAWPGATAAIVAFVALELPMLGVVQNGPQIAADRYTYFAAPALTFLAAAGLAIVPSRWLAASRAAMAAVLLVLGALTWKQTLVWRSSDALWRHAVNVSDESTIAHDGLGTVLLQQDSLDRALREYERAAEVNPNYADARANIGIVLARLGRADEAPRHFEHALELKPDFDMAENNWGVVLASQGKLMAAIGHFRLALSINPENWDAEYNWANALVDGGNADVSLTHYQRAAELNPGNPEIEARWGAALAHLGRLEEAIPHFERAISMDPSDQRKRALLARARREQAESGPRGPRK
jgi:tetratricopeptide (TPR) repeat protein